MELVTYAVKKNVKWVFMLNTFSKPDYIHEICFEEDGHCQGVNEEVTRHCNEEAVETIEDEVACNVDEDDYIGRSEPNSEHGMNHGLPSVNASLMKWVPVYMQWRKMRVAISIFQIISIMNFRILMPKSMSRCMKLMRIT